MKYTIKKYKGNWLVDDTNGGWVGFASQSEAIRYAYDQGCKEVEIRYSNTVCRVFSREALENFSLVQA